MVAAKFVLENGTPEKNEILLVFNGHRQRKPFSEYNWSDANSNVKSTHKHCDDIGHYSEDILNLVLSVMVSRLGHSPIR